MNIELDEIVVLDVSDEALEQAAGGAQGGNPGKHSWACTANWQPRGGCTG